MNEQLEHELVTILNSDSIFQKYGLVAIEEHYSEKTGRNYTVLNTYWLKPDGSLRSERIMTVASDTINAFVAYGYSKHDRYSEKIQNKLNELAALQQNLKK